MQDLDVIKTKVEDYQQELTARIDNSTGTDVLTIGVITLLIATGIAALVIKHYNYHYDRYPYTGAAVILFLLLISLLCFFTHKTIKTEQDKLFDEKILLRDICISIALCRQLPDSRTKEQTITCNFDRAKRLEDTDGTTEFREDTKEDKTILTASQALVQEKIIQTLLSRHSG